MDYSKLVTPLIKAIQELSAEVEQLKQQAHDKFESIHLPLAEYSVPLVTTPGGGVTLTRAMINRLLF